MITSATQLDSTGTVLITRGWFFGTRYEFKPQERAIIGPSLSPEEKFK